MTTFTSTWNTAYEAVPADSEDANLGASRIRDFKVAFSERFEIDHSLAGDTDDGYHKQITFVDPLGAKPTQADDQSYLYSKDVSGTSELFFEDEAGNEVQLTSGGAIPIASIVALGTIATQDSDGVDITGGTIDGTPIGGSTPAAGSFTTGAFSGSVSSTKAAESGYTRITPNYCSKDTPSKTALTRDACTAVAVPSGATMVEVALESEVIAFGSTGIISYSQVSICTAAGCAANIDGKRSYATAIEWSGGAEGNVEAYDINTVKVIPVSGYIYIKFTDDGGEGSAGYYSIQGYYD